MYELGRPFPPSLHPLPPLMLSDIIAIYLEQLSMRLAGVVHGTVLSWYRINSWIYLNGPNYKMELKISRTAFKAKTFVLYR